MKVFAIRDDGIIGRDLGYLLYYEKSKAYYIELPENSDEWETPLILSSFVRRGEHSVSAYWSRIWVEQRVIPPDRQNIGKILLDNGLNAYDDFQLLLKSDGRCAQDDLYIKEINSLPESIKTRWLYKVDDVIPLENYHLLVFFRDGAVRKCDIRQIVGDDRAFIPVVSKTDIFDNVKLQPDGYGVAWDENTVISDYALYKSGTCIPLTLNDFFSFVSLRVVNTEEAQKMLHCTRQNISDLVKRGKLHPIRHDRNNTLFLKSEVQQRMKVSE